MEQAIAVGNDLKRFYLTLAACAPFVGMLLLVVGLRVMDWLGGVDFKREIAGATCETIFTNYFAARWLGGCFVIGCSLLMLGLVLAS